MNESTRQLGLVLRGRPDVDQEELDELTLRLREQIMLELDVHNVELLRSDGVPEGAKPGEVIALGAMTVTVAPLVLRGVLRLLETWIQNRPVRTVSITIGEDVLEVEATSSADQRRLIDAFIHAHTGNQPAAPGLSSGSGPEPEPEEVSGG
ncbi:hypothetical protein ACIHFB_08155 [Streptomyces sp. NPDC051963]|uniref:hypothetical protein n=1 Tax=Streptomyces sp. NPDC051963 TaxID=3365678 RepID=UPI0037D223B3